MFCRSCGAQNAEGATFCSTCGASLSTSPDTPSWNTAPTPAPLPEQNPSSHPWEAIPNPNPAFRPAPEPAHKTKPARNPLSPASIVSIVLSVAILVALVILPWLSLAPVPRAFVADLGQATERLEEMIEDFDDSGSGIETMAQKVAIEQIGGNFIEALSEIKADYAAYEAGALTANISELLDFVGQSGLISSSVQGDVDTARSALDTLTPICSGAGIAALATGALCLASNIAYLASGRRRLLKRLTVASFALVAVVSLAWIVVTIVANGIISSELVSLASSDGGFLSSVEPTVKNMAEAFQNYAVSFPFFALPLGTLVALALSVGGIVSSALPARKAWV